MTEAREQDLLQGKLSRCYPGADRQEAARQILAEYGTARHEHEPDRVRLAIVKLAGTDLESLRRYTRMAKQDYRDVLAWAEYPLQSKAGAIKAGPDKDRLIRKDREQYEQWLFEDGPVGMAGT